MMTNSYLADFVAIAMSTCRSNPTKFCVTDGRVDIHDVGHVMRPIQSYCIN